MGLTASFHAKIPSLQIGQYQHTYQVPSCPSYYSQSTTERKNMSFDSKEDEILQQAVALSLTLHNEEREKYLTNSLQDLKVKLTFISPTNWSLWFPN